MTAPQSTAYLPAPISQRDGSALANSNCRMASIATGIDYHTRGATRSTGSKMRSYTSDQSGGTDSGDAVESWRTGYGQTLTVRDGYTFDNALQDLGDGSLVHLDVWAASMGGCLSGSGAYGHTVAVAPDYSSAGWYVADPWCSPPEWQRITESKLRAGAEEWSRRVYGRAVDDPDYPTSGSRQVGDPLHPVALAIVRRIARELMTLADPGNEWTGPDVPAPRDWPGETGGGSPILFTRTKAIEPTAGGGDEMGVQLTMIEPFDGTATVVGSGHSWIRVWDGYMGAAGAGFTKQVFARAKLAAAFETPGSSPAIPKGTPVVMIGDDCAVFLEQDVDLVENVAGGGTGGETADEAYARGRADEWAAWADGLGVPDPPS